MAQINIPTKLDIPDSIEIKLVRYDYLETSNIFRILFEVFVALFSGVVGAFISLDNISCIHCILLAILLVSSITFLLLWLRYNKKSLVESVSTSSVAKELPIKANGLIVNIGMDSIVKVNDILTELNLKNENVIWRTNKIKTAYKTLNLKNLSNEVISIIIEKFESNKIDFIDQKMVF